MNCNVMRFVFAFGIVIGWSALVFGLPSSDFQGGRDASNFMTAFFTGLSFFLIFFVDCSSKKSRKPKS